MTDRYDCLCVREYEDGYGEKKTSWTRIGVAFPAKSGDGYTILLDAMPAPKRGVYQIILRPPLPRDGDRQRQEEPAQAPAQLDDEVPFSPIRE